MDSGAGSRAFLQQPGRSSVADQIWLKILHSQLVNICEEMAVAMMRTAYSPVFNEGLDFSFVILDREGELMAMANMNPAMLGQALFSGRWVLDDLGAEDLAPGDVVVHNDPYRGGSHMPEHLLITPFFHERELRGFLATIGHVAEIGGMAPGSFSSNATEIYQEGLRLPPVKLMRAGEPVRDVWRIMFANHRTPDTTWGDFNAMIGALNIGCERLGALYDEHGAQRIAEGMPALYDYAEAWMRRDIAQLPDGTYSGEDCQEDDGFARAPVYIRCDLTVDGERIVVDYSRSDPQARGAINGPYVVTASATYNGIFQVIGSEAPINAGAFRPIDIIAPPGTVVNVRSPGACVGGQTELQPRLIDIIQGRILSQVVPERCAAACGGTSCNFLFGGVHPRTGDYYTHYNFEGIGWGGRAQSDGNDAQIVPHGNCQNTPVEVFETRFPWRHDEYRLNPDGGGAGRTRGGLGVTRTMTVQADEVVVSALCDRSIVAPWGLQGGYDGQRTAFLVKRAGEPDFERFSEAFGTVSDTKFSNVRLRRGDQVRLRSPSGGGYGPPGERPVEQVLEDVRAGYVSVAAARHDYGVAIDERGNHDDAQTRRLREEMSGVGMG
jgi:N-methylhydantoinase B/oxoprolinase/acetone carboxylase alpha subunit